MKNNPYRVFPTLAIGLGVSLCVATATAQDLQPLLDSGQIRPYTVVKPLPVPPGTAATGAGPNAAIATRVTVPIWTRSITSPLDGYTYSPTLVGTSPYVRNAKTTTIPTQLIPLRVAISDTNGTHAYDAGLSDTCAPGSAATIAAQSPLFKSATFSFNGVAVGTTQYTDAFRRANFWDAVSTISPKYHTLLTLKNLPAVAVAVPSAGGGGNYSIGGGCAPQPGTTSTLGLMDINWLDSYLQTTVLPALTALGYVSPTSFPIFLLYNVALSDGAYDGSNCCILGYHSAMDVTSGIQTYAVATYDSTGAFGADTDVSILSHEVAEWLDDPFGGNPTPAWGHVGQVGACQNNLENADPLTGTLLPGVTMANGRSYHLQELAFFSWFYRQVPSTAVNGSYSNNGTFTAAQGACL